MPLMGIPTEGQRNSSFANIAMKNTNSPAISNEAAGVVAGAGGRTGKIDNSIIDRLNGVDSRKAPYERKRSKEMGRDEFLTLLSHQLQNQDPMSPMDQNKMMGDLAQLSQLEQLTNMRKVMEKQGSNNGIEKKFYGAGLIGKRVYTSGSTISFKDDGTPAQMRFNLDNDAEKVFVRIFDSKSNMVYQEELAGLSKGFHEIKWDGSTLDGTVSPKGQYVFQVRAYDKNDQEIKNETKISGIVKGVEFVGDDTVLLVDDKKVDLLEVDKFEVGEVKAPHLNKKEIVKKYDDSSKMKEGQF